MPVHYVEQLLGWSVIFQSGRHDGFSPCDVDFFLDVTGEVSEGLTGYTFENVTRLAAARGRGTPGGTEGKRPHGKADRLRPGEHYGAGPAAAAGRTGQGRVRRGLRGQSFRSPKQAARARCVCCRTQARRYLGRLAAGPTRPLNAAPGGAGRGAAWQGHRLPVLAGRRHRHHHGVGRAHVPRVL